MLPLSFTTLGCPGWTLRQIVENAAAMGYDAIDFRGLLDTLDITASTEFTTDLAATKRLIADHGLAVSGIATSARYAVVDAEDLHAASVVKQYCEKVDIPFLPESLTWEPEFKSEWKDWEMWHLDAGDSTGFQRDMEDFGYTVDDVPELKEMYEKCRPLYEKMYAERLRP